MKKKNWAEKNLGRINERKKKGRKEKELKG